jgi:peptidoglycan/LPS O-acetylase OafA/YrhL
MSLKNTASVKYDNNFNFLRIILAVLVILSHSPELIDGDRHREILTNIFHTISFGEFAVDGFFLLSGYLITQSWQRDPLLFKFLKKRIIRIYPAFICATLICAFIVAPAGVSSPNYFIQFNVFKFLKGILVLDSPVIPSLLTDRYYPFVNGSMWTIAYEFRCYLLVAIFGTISTIKTQKVWLGFSVFIILLSIFPSLSGKIYFQLLPYIFGNPSDLTHLLSFFCAGGSFYLFRDRIYYSKNIILITATIVIISLFNSYLLALILPTLGTYLFFWFALLDIPMLQKFGTYSDISYGVYLYGWPSQKLLIWYFPLISPWLLFITACGMSFACGLLSWHLIEKPFLRMKPK